jgi:hypothetical protein
MVIQIIPRQQEKSPFLMNILLYFSIVLFLVTVGSYFILNNLGQKADVQIKDLDSKLAQISSSSGATLEKEILQYQQKINIFSSLLAAHQYSSQAFTFLEGITHPKVFFESFSLDTTTRIISLAGQTDSFQSLDQQINIFKKEKSIQGVELSNLSIGKEGKIPFGIKLILNQQVFEKLENNE